MPTTTPAELAGISNPYDLQADITNSTIGQADPVAGKPDPDRPTAATLAATGPQTAGVTVYAEALLAGPVGVAGAIWRTASGGVTDTYWRGADVPNVLLGFEEVSWTSATIQRDPHAVCLPDGSDVVVYATRAAGGDPWGLAVRILDPDAETYSTVSITTPTTLPSSFPPYPALCLVQDAQDKHADKVLLCAYWDVDTTADEANISIVASRDGGATWETWAIGVLPDPITVTSGSPYYTLGRIRWTAIGTSIVLFAHVTASASVGGVKEFVYQYASGTNGATFAYVTAMEDAGYPDVVAVGVSAYVAVISSASGTNLQTFIMPVPSPFVPVNAAQAVDLFGYAEAGQDAGTPYVFSFGTMALCATPSGLIYAYNMRCVSNSKTGHAAVYNPATNTATVLNVYGVTATRVWWFDGNSTSTEYPNAFAVTWWRGGVHLYTTMASTDNDFDDKICRLDLGGYSSLTLPSVSTSIKDAKWASWGQTTIPTTSIANYGYTLTGAGTESVTTNEGWDTFTTAANQIYAEINPTAANGEIWRVWKVKVTSGGGVSSRAVMCGLTWDDGAVSYSFEVRCSTTQIRFRDEYGAADGNTATVGIGTDGIYILGVIDENGTASVWYREISPMSDHYWVPLQAAYALTDGGVGTGNNVATHGNRATDTATSLWVALGGNEGDSLGVATLANGETLPDMLRPVVLSTRPEYVTDGVSLSWSGGPVTVGDSWTILGDAEHAYRLALPVGSDDSTWNVRGGTAPSALSAAKEWRGTATTGILWFEFPEPEDRYLESGLVVQFEGLNAPTVEVIGYLAASASIVSIGTHDQRSTGLEMSISGSTLIVDSGATSTSTPYWQQNELAGGYAVLDGGTVRPIIGNSAGQVKGGTQTRAPPVVYLDPATITGSETAANPVVVVYPRSTFIAFLAEGTKYKRLGLRWTAAPDIYQSYICAKIVAFGPLTSIFQAVQWGYEFGGQDPAAVAEMTSGMRFGRRVKLATRRTLTANFAVPVNQTPLYSTTDGDPLSYKLSSSAGMVLNGTFGDAPNKLFGAWMKAEGTRWPVVYVPKYAPGTPNTQSLVGANSVAMYGRMTEPTITETNNRGSTAPVVQSTAVTFTFEL